MIAYLRSMIAFTGFFAICLIAMLLFPLTGFGKLCHEELVERPASALSRFRSHHLLYAIVLIPVMLSGGEFIALLGPEFFAAYAMELAIYIDALALSLLASAYANLRAGFARFAAIIRLPLRRTKPRAARHTRGPRPHRKPVNDDDRPAPALIAA